MHDELEWFDLVGYSSHEITKCGKVRSKRTGKIYKKYINSSGYYKIKICNKAKFLHRLLAINFISNPNNYPVINHKDGNTTNNELSNLEWCTQKHNRLHSKNVLGNKHIPYSKTDKSHHELGQTGWKSKRGIPIQVTLPNGEIRIYGAFFSACEDLFGNKQLGKSVSNTLIMGRNIYRDHKFEFYKGDKPNQ